MSDRFIAIAIIIVLACISILAVFARACLCDNCKAPFAVFQRGDLQLCRQCKTGHDRIRARRRRRRSILRWIWRTSP